MFQRAKYKADLKLEDIPDAVGSVKYDGGHFFMKIDRNGKPKFISRRQSVKGHFPDRTEKLPHLAGITLPQHAGHVYSVELIHNGLDKTAPESHPMVSGILNSLAPRAIEQQMLNGPIRAVLLDVIKPTLKTYGDKLALLKQVEKQAKKPDLLFLPEFHTGAEAIKKLIDKTKAEGREGIIVASLSKPEDNNPRLKVKHKNTYNLKVRGFLQEKDIYGNLKPSLGAFELEDATGRHVGDVGVGFLKEFRSEVWNNKKAWLGKLIQIKAMPPVRAGMKVKMSIYNGEADGDLDTV